MVVPCGAKKPIIQRFAGRRQNRVDRGRRRLTKRQSAWLFLDITRARSLADRLAIVQVGISANGLDGPLDLVVTAGRCLQLNSCGLGGWMTVTSLDRGSTTTTPLMHSRDKRQKKRRAKKSTAKSQKLCLEVCERGGNKSVDMEEGREAATKKEEKQRGCDNESMAAEWLEGVTQRDRDKEHRAMSRDSRLPMLDAQPAQTSRFSPRPNPNQRSASGASRTDDLSEVESQPRAASRSQI
ncbi:hypothetical protein psal_cds_1306 [Pandoravirus salinus]|uniref:Uncharacterized protein n=1 Tax=Pandoravirus salinus TaxID=1349410 RepID=A0A291AU04_9VIRU|nr:hypothetical protein psal_cds_1306 [Pandoravirus salinus]ATE82305.1 hypothetical protein psal_cds_1306 [Pandoravirus salinus]